MPETTNNQSIRPGGRAYAAAVDAAMQSIFIGSLNFDSEIAAHYRDALCEFDGKIKPIAALIEDLSIDESKSAMEVDKDALLAIRDGLSSMQETISFLAQDLQQLIPSDEELAILQYRRDVEALRGAAEALSSHISEETAAGILSTVNAWQEIEKEFGMLASDEVARKLGSLSKASTIAADRRRARQIIGVKQKNQYKYPGFQFTAAGKVHAVIPHLLQHAEQLNVDDEDLVQWLCLPTGQLGGQRPVDTISDADAVLQAFDNHFGVEW